MTITAKVIADSVGPSTSRLVTFELKYPRFIHSEIMTHRQFSRNASSSRAIPVERQIKAIREDTAIPMHWGKNQKGMQADGECDEAVLIDGMQHNAAGAWYTARDRAIEIAEAFVVAGYHKQIVNRILEPFTHINVVLSSTHFANFFSLRRHADAQPEFKILADVMFTAMEESEPKFVDVGQWHLPYVTTSEADHVVSVENVEYADSPLTTDDLIKVSVARCARVSYKTHDGDYPTIAADMALYDRLVGGEPLHASPAEHQATPDTLELDGRGSTVWKHPGMGGNFNDGWLQYRKMLPNECVWD